MTCRSVRDHLPAIIDGAVAPEVEHELATCLRCQATAGQYRRLGRALAALAQVRISAPPSLLADVLARLDAPSAKAGSMRGGGYRTAVISGAAVAVASAVVIALAKGRIGTTAR